MAAVALSSLSVTTYRDEGRDEDSHRDLVPGTRAVAMCLGPETASGALDVRDPESESGSGCQ